MSDVSIKLAQLPQDLDAIYAIRTRVFQIEQGVDPALEFDGKDEQATHLLAYFDTAPVGTLRMREIEPGIAKLERLAVLPDFRRRGIGKQLTESALECLISKKFAQVRLHAQVAVQGFYSNLGFTAEGDIFEEAGIPHIKMCKLIRDL
jgi:predicted GNAT family N-acyltransferase